MGTQFDITPYLIGIISLITLLFSTWLVPLIKRKTTKEQQDIICSVADVVVFAAEKLYGALQGEKKLEYAIRVGMERLEKYGIKINASSLRPYIEAAVQALDLRQEVAAFMGDSYSVPGLADILRTSGEGK